MKNEIKILWEKVEAMSDGKHKNDLTHSIGHLLETALQSGQPPAVLSELYYMMGYWQYMQHYSNLELAALYFSEALRLNPDLLWAKLYLGHCYFDLALKQHQYAKFDFPYWLQAETNFRALLQQEKDFFSKKDQQWRLVKIYELLACIKIYTLSPNASEAIHQYEQIRQNTPEEDRPNPGHLGMARKWQKVYAPQPPKPA